MLASACSVINPPPSRPTPSDSLIARTVLQTALNDYWREAISRRYDLALANGGLVNVLPDVSLESRKADLRTAQHVGRDLDSINVSALSQDDYVSSLALRWEVEAQGEEAAFYWGDFSELSVTTAPLRMLADILRLQPLASVGDANRYIYFADAVPYLLGRVQTGLEERRLRGYVAPREMVESAIAFYLGARALADQGPWQLGPSRDVALDSSTRRALHAELDSIRTTRILPSLDSLVAYLRVTYLPHAAPQPGLWRSAGGKELYRHLLRRSSSLDIPPEEAHQVGLGELRRIDSTMAALRRRQHWNPDARAFHDSLRLAVGVAPSIEAVAMAIRDRQARIATALPAQFGATPMPVPLVREATPAEALLWPAGGYLAASMGDTVGLLLLTDRWRQPAVGATLASASYRLLLPGRHLEASFSHGAAAINTAWRFPETPGFADGWSQYAASLAGELGMYADPRDAYGRLLDEGSAMALLVVDSGIHYLGWSMAQARAVLGRYVLAPDAMLDTILVERVVNAPGRAGAGALGAREVAAMRAWMQNELGPDFFASDWHGELLSIGALPLPIVGSHLEWWLYDTRRRAAERRGRAAADKSNAPRKRRPPS